MQGLKEQVASAEEAPGRSDAAAEPTHSERRPRKPGEPGQEGRARASVRPSAFGPPRTSAPPPPAVRPLSSGLTPVHSRTSADDDDDAETRPAIRRIANERSRVVDQLMQEQAPASIPPPPSVEARPSTPLPGSQPAEPPLAEPARTRKPWLSIALFSGMLALSVVPLWRYAGSGDAVHPRAVAPGAAQRRSAPPVVSVAQLSPVHITSEAELESEAGLERQAQLASLVAAGNRALDAGGVSEAERLFGRVIELEEDNSRAAFGLARIRLLQGNLTGAEGWIQLALRKRPKRRAYHALYAEVLARMGRTAEAEDERAQAQQEQGKETEDTL